MRRFLTVACLAGVVGAGFAGAAGSDRTITASARVTGLAQSQACVAFVLSAMT